MASNGVGDHYEDGDFLHYKRCGGANRANRDGGIRYPSDDFAPGWRLPPSVLPLVEACWFPEPYQIRQRRQMHLRWARYRFSEYRKPAQLVLGK